MKQKQKKELDKLILKYILLLDGKGYTTLKPRNKVAHKPRN